MDTVTSSEELKLNAVFADNDTRLITLPNPRADVNAADIKAVESFMVTAKPIIGDKTGADFIRFGSAKVVESTRIKVDLT